MTDTTEERTEQATQKRMKEVRSKGQLSKSQDLSAWLVVGAAAVMLPTTLSFAGRSATEQLLDIETVIADPDPSVAVAALEDAWQGLSATLGPMFAVVVLAALVTAAAQGGIHFRAFRMKGEQFNLVGGAKRVFGAQALWEGAKALLKTAVVGLALYLVVQGLLPILMATGGFSVAVLLEQAATGTAALLQVAVTAGLALAAADLFVVMRRNRKRTRMTKKEVKDESKAAEGDPLIKAQRRSRQLQMSRNRMIAAVSGADVVLVNPTHVAVALKYEPGKAAPRIVAKGAGTIAAKIREKAEAGHVPMVRDIPLARALHAACEVGEEIPVELYTAVARVLVFVMALKSRGAAQGLHTMSPSAA